MKCLIIGDQNRKDKDSPIIEEAERSIEDVEYAPITQIRFDLGSEKQPKISYDGKDLSEYDCIIVIPTITHSELFYTALWMMNGKAVPINAEKYLMMMNDELLFNFLDSKGINVRNHVTLTSNASLDRVDGNISYPSIVKPPKKRVMVTNKQTLKDIVSLYKIGTPILIEEPIKSKKTVWMFVLGNEIIAAYEKSGKTRKTIAVDEKLRKTVLKIKQSIGCDYCSIKMIYQKGEWILDKVALSPNFRNFEKVTGVNIARHIISYCKRTHHIEKTWLYEKIEDMFRIKR